MGRIRSSRKQDKIKRGYKGIYTSLLFAALRAEVPKRKIDQISFRPPSSEKRSDCIRYPRIQTDVEIHPSMVLRNPVDHMRRPVETLCGCDPMVTIETVGAHYLIRIFTKKKYTPLSIYLSKLELESMEVINLTMFKDEKKLFYAILIQGSAKSQSEIDLLRHQLYCLACTKSGQNCKAE